MWPATSNRRTRVWFAVTDHVFSRATNGNFTFAVAVAFTTESFGEIAMKITAPVVGREQ